MPLSSAINHILIDEAGGSGSLATLEDINLVFGSFGDNTETVPIGDNTSHRVGAKQTLAFTSYVNGTSNDTADFGKIGITDRQDLYAAMLAGTEKRIRFVFDGSSSNTYAYDKVKVTVTPRIGPIDQNKCTLYATTEGAATLPSLWTNLGDMLAGSSPQFSIISANNGCGKPIYAGMEMTWEVDLFTEAGSTIEAITPTGKLKIAIGHGTTPETYTQFDEVKFHHIPNADDNFVYTRAVFSARWYDPRDDSKMVFPTMPNHLGGFDVEGTATGTGVSDFLTIS